MKHLRDYSIGWKLGAIVVMLAAVGITNYVCVSYIKQQQQQDARVIDVAGRNRMLSQKIGFYAERLFRGQLEVKDSLKSAITLHHQSLQALKSGGVLHKDIAEKSLPPTSPDIMPTLEETESHWIAYQRHAQDILSSTSSSTATEQAELALQLLERNAPRMLAQNNRLVQKYVRAHELKQAQFQKILVGLLVVNLILVGLVMLVVRRYIANPLQLIRQSAEQLSRGELSAFHQHPFQDEVGQTINHMNTLTRRLTEAAAFAEQVGQGDFSASFQPASKKDGLGSSLLRMQQQLHASLIADKERSFTSRGLAQLNVLLRDHRDEPALMANSILSFLVKYLQANQGGLYAVTKDQNLSPCLVALALYAWSKERHVEQHIYPGQGLTGQVWLERKTAHVSSVPEDYVRITSGLGEATPRSLLIVPLTYNDDVLGVLELASLRPYTDHEIAFLEQAAEDMAVTLSQTQSGRQTEQLLEEAQQRTETMQATEEEMRQNMEELSATQEEMERNEREYLSKIALLEEKLQALESVSAGTADPV